MSALFSPSQEDTPGNSSHTGAAPQRPRDGAPPAAALTLPVKMSSPSESLSGAPSPRCSGKGGGRRSAGEGERDPRLPPDAIAAASARARPAGSSRHALTRGAGPPCGRAADWAASLPAPPPATANGCRRWQAPRRHHGNGVAAVPLWRRKEERGPAARRERGAQGGLAPQCPG